jgi:hypothetical protein
LYDVTDVVGGWINVDTFFIYMFLPDVALLNPNLDVLRSHMLPNSSVFLPWRASERRLGLSIAEL